MLSSRPVRFGCLVTGNSPAATSVNNTGAALASVRANVSWGDKALCHPPTTFCFRKASIAQEHVEGDAAVKIMLQLHHVDDMQSTGSTV